MPKDFLPKTSESKREQKPTSNIEDIKEYDDIKDLDEDRVRTEDELRGEFQTEEGDVGLPQAKLDSIILGEKDLYVVTFDWSVSAAPDDFLTHFFTCHYPSEILSISEVHGAGAVATIQINKVPSGLGIASGTALLTTTFNLASAVNTPVIKDVKDLVSGTRFLDRGDRLGIRLITGGTAGLQFVTISVYLQYRNRGEYRNAQT